MLVQTELGGPVLLLELLQKDDFYVRFPTVQLLTRLLERNPEATISQILDDPNAVMSLVEVLDDPRESVRNEGLLLLKVLPSASHVRSRQFGCHSAGAPCNIPRPPPPHPPAPQVIREPP